MSPKELKLLCRFQQNEVTEGYMYEKLANIKQNANNQKTLKRIGADENRHAEIFAKYTGKSFKPNKLKAQYYILLARIFGLTFAIKLMAKGENKVQEFFSKMDSIPEIPQILNDEIKHEEALMGMIQEEKLNYLGSIVLGLNDALVELTGALAGFTLALESPQLVALTGSITGISAALSMASSEYLSARMDNDSKHARKASVYTGTTYLLTVIILILPFILCANVLISLSISIICAITIIAMFNYYYSVVKGESFKRRFSEMAGISLSVAAISFLIGYLLKLLMEKGF